MMVVPDGQIQRCSTYCMAIDDLLLLSSSLSDGKWDSGPSSQQPLQVEADSCDLSVFFL
jgi:hypothetical protein